MKPLCVHVFMFFFFYGICGVFSDAGYCSSVMCGVCGASHAEKCGQCFVINKVANHVMDWGGIGNVENYDII